MDRLLREANPPTGQLASPKPQYKKPGEDAYEPVEGQYGAPFAILKNASGQVISPATDAKLEQVKSELELVKSELQTIKANQLSGDQKVTLSGINAELEALMQGFATEDKLEQVRQLLTGVATENKLEQARTLLEAISTKDFATSSKQDALKIAVEDLKSELNLVKSELANIKANQLSGDQKVQLSGTKVVESAPVTGIKTVTSTVAEVFAGSSWKANRSKLVIRNLHQAVAIRIGGSGITDTIGQSLEPGASVEIDFSPSTAVLIYAVSTAGNVSVEVLEV